MVIGNFTAPNNPLAGAIRDLMVVRTAEQGLLESAFKVAPPYSLPAGSGSSGTYPVETGYVGLSLVVDPLALTGRDPGGTEFPPTPTQYDARPYSVKWYPIGTKLIVAALEADLQDTSGIVEQDRVAVHQLAKWSSTLYQLVMSAVGNTGNYATGYTYDPGNIASATFDIIAAAEGVEQRFRDAGIDVSQSDIKMVYARGTAGALRTLNQVMGGIVNPTPTGRAQPMETLRAFIQEALGCRSLEMVPDNGRYINAAGTSASRLSAAIAFVVTAVGGGNRSFLKTLTKAVGIEGATSAGLDPAAAEALNGMDIVRGMYGVRAKYDPGVVGGGGIRVYAEAAVEVNLVDNTAAVLWTSVLT